MMLGAIIALAVLAAILAAGCAVLFFERRNLKAHKAELAGELADTEQQRDQLRDSLHQRDNELTKLTEQLHNLEQQQQVLEEAKKQLESTFESLAGRALKGSTDEFLKLAKQVFESEQGKAQKHLDAHRQSIESLIKPVRETLDKYNSTLQEVEKARNEAYGALRQQLSAMANDQTSLRQETAKLTNALRRPDVRGRWGEMQLRRVAEIAGMIENCDFEEQVHLQGEDGSLRPDMVVHLPNERVIVVDAKASLDAYLDAMETTDQQQRQEHYTRHLRHIEGKVQQLSQKDYAEAVSRQVGRTPDFVVMFIPGESFLYPAVQQNPDLLESAMNRGVVIATPSTLISLLKAVAMGWREERLAENARRISEAGRELHRRMATAFGHLDRLQSSIGKVVDHFNSLVGSLESSVLPQARRFEELEAGSPKKLPETLDGVERTARAPKAVETPDE